MKNRNEEAAFLVPIGNTDERKWKVSYERVYKRAIRGL